MKTRKERIPEIHFYEWSITRWLSSSTRAQLDAKGRGIYRDLLDLAYAQGAIPSNRTLMAAFCACTEADIEAIWPVIGKHFSQKKHDKNALENRFATIERKNFFRYLAKQRKSGKAGGRPKSKDDSDKESDRLPDEEPTALEKSAKTETQEEWRGVERSGRNIKPLVGSITREQQTELEVILGDMDPLDWYRSVFVGEWLENTWRTFATAVNTAERLYAFVKNTRLWMRTRKYRQGFGRDSVSWLKSGIWLDPPAESLLLEDEPREEPRPFRPMM